MDKRSKSTQPSKRQEKPSNRGQIERPKMRRKSEEGHPEQYAGGPEHRGGDAREDRNP